MPIFLIFAFRWFLYEPFVIPSESMVPNLLIHDHILVQKYSYGFKPPLGDGWLIRFRQPERGDVVVFRYPENRNVFYIKRLIGLPGDVVKVQSGQITVNDKPWGLVALNETEFSESEEFNYYNEFPEPPRSFEKPHTIRFFKNEEHVEVEEKEFVVPQDSYFVMGDNRDQSRDSRFWGFVPGDLIVGRASIIWMSCESTLDSAPFICNPLRLRTGRFMKTID
ncbi:MAG: signal peptidase I [Bdellovibrionaceae bacterium]|nr:signal peptidase I [Bdellovibrio sp.]